MYNHLLDTFVEVVDNKSFTNAANTLFISPTAIMKQINSLEKELGLTLFKRNTKGIELTSPGKVIYNRTKEIKELSNDILKEAKKATERYDTTICVGTSLLNPAKKFLDIWHSINDDFENYKIHLVPFDDDIKKILFEIKSIGKKYDFIIGVCNAKTWLKYCNFLKLYDYKKMIAVPNTDPLAKKRIVHLKDLYGRTLVMVKKGESSINDNIREYLEKEHPQIKIEDTAYYYDLSTFNYCYESKKILLTIECWKNIHPLLKTIKVDWGRDFTIPYGILYPLKPDSDIKDIINKIKKSMNK